MCEDCDLTNNVDFVCFIQ